MGVSPRPATYISLMGLPGNLTCSLERLALRCTYFHHLSVYKSTFIQGNAMPLQPYQNSFVSMPVSCVAGTTLDFGLAGVGDIFFWRWLHCTKAHELLSSCVVIGQVDCDSVD